MSPYQPDRNWQGANPERDTTRGSSLCQNAREKSNRWALGCGLVAAVAAACLAWPAAAATRRVPLDHPTIQGAIVAASPGDSILVAPGLYLENVDTQGKRLTLVGEAGPEATTVDGRRLGSVLRLSGGGLIEGFTIRNGHAEIGGGIDVVDSDGVIIRNCLIEGNLAGFGFDSGSGGGVMIYQSSDVLIESNIIRDNYAGDSGGGIFELGDRVELRGNRIERNGAHVSGGGAEVTTALVFGNLILNNQSDSFGAGLNARGSIRAESNTVVGNYNDNSFPQPAGISASYSTLKNNLVVHNRGRGGSGAGIDAARCQLYCNNAWGNDFIDYGLFETDTTGRRNVSLDPILCNEAAWDLTLSANSPCAPDHSNGCGLIGALPVACSITSTRKETWGSVKLRYR